MLVRRARRFVQPAIDSAEPSRFWSRGETTTALSFGKASQPNRGEAEAGRVLATEGSLCYTCKTVGGRAAAPRVLPQTRSSRQEQQKLKLARARETKQFRQQVGLPSDEPPQTPQRLYHFTLDDQITALVTARQSDPEMGFLMRMVALCSLPRTDPGRRERYVRRNGPWRLIMVAGGEQGRLPYGILPRLILAWICTEAVRTRCPTLVLGRSLSHFMRELGLNDSAGRTSRRSHAAPRADEAAVPDVRGAELQRTGRPAPRS